LLSDEVEPLCTNRSVCPATGATAGRTRVLATLAGVRPPKVKFTVATTAASDELSCPFSAAVLATPFPVTDSDIQVHGIHGESERGLGQGLGAASVAPVLDRARRAGARARARGLFGAARQIENRESKIENPEVRRRAAALHLCPSVSICGSAAGLAERTAGVRRCKHSAIGTRKSAMRVRYKNNSCKFAPRTVRAAARSRMKARASSYSRLRRGAARAPGGMRAGRRFVTSSVASRYRAS
jgi:hypothetical protein